MTVLPRDGVKLKDVKATDMAEDIDFARKNPVKLNFGFYMKKFKNPILKIFEPFPELEVENLFKKYEEKVDVLTRLAAQPLQAGDASSSLSGMKSSRSGRPARTTHRARKTQSAPNESDAPQKKNQPFKQKKMKMLSKKIKTSAEHPLSSIKNPLKIRKRRTKHCGGSFF